MASIRAPGRASHKIDPARLQARAPASVRTTGMVKSNLCGAFALASLLSPISSLSAQTVAPCGSRNERPYFHSGILERDCVAAQPRSYAPRFSGTAYDVLSIESVACFVPDTAFETLDGLVGEAVHRVEQRGLDRGRTTKTRVLAISRIVSDLLAERAYGLHIPTRTLADALTARPASPPTEPSHIFDCDIGSLILLTVAEHFKLPASMADSRLPSGAGHNYVEWRLGSDRFNWDMNLRGECTTLSDQPSWLGYGMSDKELKSYILNIRGGTWARVGHAKNGLVDFEDAMTLAPNRPDPFNSYAWAVATIALENRAALKEKALAAAQHAVALDRAAGNLDTLACTWALNGDFAQAASVQDEAVSLASEPDKTAFRKRGERFSAIAPYDCTGE